MARSQEEYMKLALAEARQAFEKGEIPVGAVVVCRDRVIGRGHNMTETLNDVTAHADIMAITSAASTLGGKYLQDCTLYVTVEPCAMCAGAIGWAQVACLVYGTRDEKKGYTSVAPAVLHPKTTVISGILEDECRQLISQFFRMKRARNE